MEVKYKRDANKNYMILCSPQTQDYQLRMMCENNIKGLLTAHTSVFDGQEEIYYEISSKQPLSRMYAKKEMGYEDIKRILFSMESVFLELKKYLLDGSNLLLGPEFCYCNPDSKKTEWIFYPAKSEKNDFMELAEFFLEHTDHKDEKGVELAYRFFKCARTENFVLQEIICYVEELERTTDTKTEIELQAPAEEEYVPVVFEEKPEKNDSFWNKLKKTVENKVEELAGKTIRGKEKRTSQKERKEVPMMSVSDWEGYSEPAYAYTGETTVIGITGEGNRHQFRSLNPEEYKNIGLSGNGCIIGKMPEQADIVLTGDGISRIHAKVFEESGIVYLQDLNSTNGTFKNGIRLEANEIVQLRPGDEVGFAKMIYIYE